LLYVVLYVPKLYSIVDSFICCKQNRKMVSFNLGHPVDFIQTALSQRQN